MAKKETVRVQGGAAEGLRDKASSHLPLTLKWLRKEGLPVLLPREGNLRGNLLRVVGTQVSAGENLHNKKRRVDSVDLSPLRALPWTPTAPSCPGRLCCSFPAGFLTPLLLAPTSRPSHCPRGGQTCLSETRTSSWPSWLGALHACSWNKVQIPEVACEILATSPGPDRS